jgi:hypothetical protein
VIGIRDVVIGWGISEVELLELAVRQWVDPLAALRAELVVRELGTAVGAGMFAQPESFLSALLCHASMVLWAIRTTDTWTPANIAGALILVAAVSAAVFWAFRVTRRR